MVANQHREQLVTVQPVGLGAPRAAIDFDARRIHHDVVDTVRDEPAVQPEAVAPGLITAAHARLRRQPAARLGLGNALEQRRGVPCRHRIAARAAHAVAQRQLPILLTQFERHVQLARFYRMLSLKGCSRRIHFALLPLNRVGRTLVLTQGGKSRTALHSICDSSRSVAAHQRARLANSGPSSVADSSTRGYGLSELFRAPSALRRPGRIGIRASEFAGSDGKERFVIPDAPFPAAICRARAP